MKSKLIADCNQSCHYEQMTTDDDSSIGTKIMRWDVRGYKNNKESHTIVAEVTAITEEEVVQKLKKANIKWWTFSLRSIDFQRAEFLDPKNPPKIL